MNVYHGTLLYGHHDSATVPLYFTFYISKTGWKPSESDPFRLFKEWVSFFSEFIPYIYNVSNTDPS